MAPLIDVLPRNDRGASTSRSPKLRALPLSPITVQSTTMFCMPTVAHSRKHTAMRRCGPEVMAFTTSGWVMAAAAPSRCSLNLGSVTLRETSAASTSSMSTGSAARTVGASIASARPSSVISFLILHLNIACLSPYLEHQLALEVARRTDAERPPGLRQLEQRDLGRADGADATELGDPLEVWPVARHRRPQRSDIAAIRLGRLRAGGDEGRASAPLQHGEGACRDVAAHGLEHRVAVLRDLGEIRSEERRVGKEGR